LQFLEYLVLFENKIRYTLGILKAYKALNIPQIDTEVIQRKPVHLHPAADLLPIKFSHAQNLSPVFSHIKTNLLVHGLIAPGSTASKPGA